MSQKKKSLVKQESGIAMKNQPHALWGVFQNFQQDRWHKVVKRLPRPPRIPSGKHHAGGHERAKSTSNAVEVEHDNENIVDKCTAEAKHNAPAHKNSVKSRIKALTGRKTRHRRSKSYPIRPSPVDDILNHHKGKSSLDHVVEGSSPTNISPNVRVNYLKQSELNQLGKEPVRDHTVLHGNLIYAIEPSKDDALNESKLFMNALTLLNMREEMFMNILKDPSSSLANQMQARQTPNLRFGLNKSMSFCAPNPPESKDVKMNRSRIEKSEDNKDQKINNNEGLDITPPPLPPSTIAKKKSEERVGLMHFKNVREKIKYVIRDRKKEKTRITMDALHHKVPYGVSPSKKLCEDIQHQRTDFGVNKTQSYKRISSFDESLDRYNQLIDVSSSKEAKFAKPTIRRKSAALGRILSSPEIRSYACNNGDGDSDKVCIRKINVRKEKPLDQLDSQESGKQEEAADDSKAEEKGSKDESEASPSPQPSKQENEASPHPSKQENEASISQDSREGPSKDDHHPIAKYNQESKEQKLETWLISDDDMIDLDIEEGELELFDSHVSEGAVGIVQESQIHELYNDLIQMQEDHNNKAEFNYVKGVLELSGFSKNEPLGEWQSAENPLDPSMFGEVGGSSADCHDYYGNEDGVSNQLLLFDLINEVLLHVHERSFCYWPRPLTCRSSMHPLPKGSRVLEEVWTEIRWMLVSRPEYDEDDDPVSRDLAKNDGWMNLQLDAECVGIELEELIFDDLVHEIFGG